MSNSYSAGQYDSEFNPKRLQMHEVPKPAQSVSKVNQEQSIKDEEKPKLKKWIFFLNQTPRKKSTELTFIANEKGHLLPGTRKSDTNPFGDYVGTWDMPKKIPGPYHLVRV